MYEKILTNIILIKGYKKIEIFHDNKKVKANGIFSSSNTIAEFETEEEAKAFIEGLKWTVKYYDGTMIYGQRDLSIENLDLSVRAYNCCTRGGYYYLSDFEGKTKYDLMQIRNLGKKTIEEIINKCKKYGIVIK